MNTETSYRIVKISSKGVMTILETFDSRPVADIWVDGFVRGGGIAHRGKGEKPTTIEVQEVVVR